MCVFSNISFSVNILGRRISQDLICAIFFTPLNSKLKIQRSYQDDYEKNIKTYNRGNYKKI